MGRLFFGALIVSISRNVCYGEQYSFRAHYRAATRLAQRRHRARAAIYAARFVRWNISCLPDGNLCDGIDPLVFAVDGRDAIVYVAHYGDADANV